MTAKEARELMAHHQKILISREKEMYDKCIAYIKKEIQEKGSDSLTYWGDLTPRIVTNLRSDGYKIEIKQDNDPRGNSTYYEIKW